MFVQGSAVSRGCEAKAVSLWALISESIAPSIHTTYGRHEVSVFGLASQRQWLPAIAMTSATLEFSEIAERFRIAVNKEWRQSDVLASKRSMTITKREGSAPTSEDDNESPARRLESLSPQRSWM
jgi:hypothetical protein